jgi:uncharacterized protein (TIGR02217 family)
MAFIESRLLDCVAYGTAGGPTWVTRKVALRSGIVRRNPRRSRPLYRFNIIYRNLLPDHHSEVIAAFNACFGGAHSFRLRDWSDYQVSNELIGVATGSAQTVQLAKLYEFGNQNVSRPIRKPVSGTVVLTANSAPLAATIDYTTGEATFTATAAQVVRWSGQFDVPVMFEDDEMLFSGDARGESGLFLTSDVALLEDISV